MAILSLFWDISFGSPGYGFQTAIYRPIATERFFWEESICLLNPLAFY
jgi:hypothetical protein